MSLIAAQKAKPRLSRSGVLRRPPNTSNMAAHAVVQMYICRTSPWLQMLALVGQQLALEFLQPRKTPAAAVQYAIERKAQRYKALAIGPLWRLLVNKARTRRTEQRPERPLHDAVELL